MPPEKYYRHGPVVRLVHFLHLGAMVVLILSGFHILYPSSFAVFGTMNTARKMHFFGMYLILCTLIFRYFYHAWITGDIGKLCLRRRDFSSLPATVKYYLFISREKPWGREYNPLQKMVYLLWPILLILSAVTGFAMYWPGELGGVVAFFGGLLYLKLWHTVIAWIFLFTVVLHLYLGSTGSTILDLYRAMVTGYETVEKES